MGRKYEETSQTKALQDNCKCCNTAIIPSRARQFFSLPVSPETSVCSHKGVKEGAGDRWSGHRSLFSLCICSHGWNVGDFHRDCGITGCVPC